jgi:hypothetical protein
MIELKAGSHDAIVNGVTSWAAYLEGDTVTLVGVFLTKPNSSGLSTEANASLQFRMTKEIAGKLVRQLAPWHAS